MWRISGVLLLALCIMSPAAWARRQRQQPFIFLHHAQQEYFCAPIPEATPTPTPSPTPSPAPAPGPRICVTGAPVTGDQGDVYPVTVNGQSGTLVCAPGTDLDLENDGCRNGIPPGCMLMMAN